MSVFLTVDYDAAPEYHKGAIRAHTLDSPVGPLPFTSDAVRIAAGSETEDEVGGVHKLFTVISGVGQLQVGDEIQRVASDQRIWVPAGAVHRWSVGDDGPVLLSVVKWQPIATDLGEDERP